MARYATRLPLLLATLSVAAACPIEPVTAAEVPSEVPAPNPLASVRLYVDPASAASQLAESWKQSKPGDAALLSYIAAQPQAKWIGEWSGDVRAEVARTVAAAGQRVPVL